MFVNLSESNLNELFSILLHFKITKSTRINQIEYFYKSIDNIYKTTQNKR